jgi:maltose O-acetyltransferase
LSERYSQRIDRLRPAFFAEHRMDSVWWDWLVNRVAASTAWNHEVRGALLRRAGIDVGTTQVEPGCFFFSDQIEFGDYGWVNHRCYFDTRDGIRIGSRVALGMEVMLCTSTHEPGDQQRRAGPYASAPVTIGDGTWIGTRALILPGVTVGEGCVVAAGAVVREDCEPGGLYAGVPARRVRDLA